MWKRARWLKVPKEEIAEKNILAYDMTGRFAYFRCEVTAPAGTELTVDITANARYRLWVNGRPVLSGPCKGDRHRQYYETISLTEYLRSGKNVFCAQVLCCDAETADVQTDERASIYGVISHSCGHRFAIEGVGKDKNGSELFTLTSGIADWRVYLDGSYYLKSSEVTQFLGAVTEDLDMAETPWNWKTIDYDMTSWRKAAAAETVDLSVSPLFAAGVIQRFRIREREIPEAYEREGRFVRAFQVPSGEEIPLLQDGKMTVAAGQKVQFVLDAGYIQNTYPSFRMEGGKGGILSITYFEKFGGEGSDLKRTDYIHGKIVGMTDRVRVPGGKACFEPFWVRCFRFLSVSVEAEEEALTLYVPEFRRTGYPLETGSAVRSSGSWVKALWDICVRTLENCMLETYMDCPYYEQLQFAMDTRLEALYTYAAAADPRMARKALIDFHYGMLPEGLTPGKYPSVYLQILSSFSLHYIFMAWEYYQETGDRETARMCLGDTDRILDHYDSHIGKSGLIEGVQYWQFVDWLDQWGKSAGMPEALLHGPSTIINLMYLYALDCAQKLACELGRNGLAAEYAERRQKLAGQIEVLCWDDEHGLYREGPDFQQYTRHAQAWAVLCRLKTGAFASQMLQRAIADGKCLHCTFSTSYEWFRALEMTGLYGEMRSALDEWIALLDLDCTCCPETPKGARSDCHAWSALPMYEMTRTMAGVQNAGIAWDRVMISPHLMDLPDLEGSVITPKGKISFSYDKDKAVLDIPYGMNAEFADRKGNRIKLVSGHNEIKM